MAKNKEKKKKDRERKVAQKKLANQKRMREKSAEEAEKGAPKRKKRAAVAAPKTGYVDNNKKSTFLPRRTGG